MIERITIASREQWLALRKRDVTASVVGALAGVHPYTSKLRLFKEKTGLDLDKETNVRMRRGSRLERAVAEEVQEKRPDWKISPAGVYLRDPAIRIGATPDFFIDGDPRGRGVLQTKVSTIGAFKSGWQQDGETRPPFWIRLQTLTEMMLSEVSWGVVAVYIDHPFNDDCHIFEIERHAAAEARIRADVVQFWDDVAWGIEPDVDPARDAELIAALFPKSEPFKTVDLSGDNYLPTLLAERAEIKERIKTDEARCKEIETEVRAKMRDAEVAVVNGFHITNKTQERDEHIVRASRFRKLSITDLRAKEITSGKHAF